MKYVLCRAAEKSLKYSAETVLALHFIMTEHNPRTDSGVWRSNSAVVADVEGEIVYEAPPAESVPSLMNELVDWLNAAGDEPPLVRAAITHLNILRIHPCHDGNGRIARAMQTLILMREGSMVPNAASLEEYVGHHTRDYNEVLNSIGKLWEPGRDITSWIRFCLTAHYDQVLALVTRLARLEDLLDEMSERLKSHSEISEGAVQSLSRIFGARPAVIARWWRMRPDSVIEKLTLEKQGYGLRGRPVTDDTAAAG
jgi:Fic family protein